MARGVYYSGDLAGLNDAMASEEMNRIRARTANQGFLGQLAGEATRRRGQDTEERIARGRNETEMGIQESRAGEQRFATQGNKERNAFALQESIRNYQLERDKLAQIQANASSLNALENRKLDALIKDNAARGKQLVAIALIQSQAMQNRVDPRIGVETAGINAGIEDQNQAAKSAAEIANLKAANSEWFGKPTARDMEEVFSSLPPDQQALLSIDLNARQFNPRVRPSVDPRTGLPITPLLQSPVPSVATPPISGNRVFTPEALRLRNLPQGTGPGPLTISGGSPTNAMPTMGGAGQLDLQSILQMLAQ
jgi:hypothetical protein